MFYDDIHLSFYTEKHTIYARGDPSMLPVSDANLFLVSNCVDSEFEGWVRHLRDKTMEPFRVIQVERGDECYKKLRHKTPKILYLILRKNDSERVHNS